MACLAAAKAPSRIFRCLCAALDAGMQIPAKVTAAGAPRPRGRRSGFQGALTLGAAWRHSREESLARAATGSSASGQCGIAPEPFYAQFATGAPFSPYDAGHTRQPRGRRRAERIRSRSRCGRVAKYLRRRFCRGRISSAPVGSWLAGLGQGLQEAVCSCRCRGSAYSHNKRS